MRFRDLRLIEDDMKDTELFMLAHHAFDPTVSSKALASSAEALHILDQRTFFLIPFL